MAFLAAIPAAIGSFVGSAGLGTVLSVTGSVLSGVSAFAAAQQQAKIANRNAALAEENALEEAERAQISARQSDEEIAAFIGQQEAVQSASGLLTTGRSQRQTRAATARIGRQDALNIIEQGRVNSQNYFQQAADFKAEAKQAKSAGMFGLAKGIIGGASSLVGASSPTRSTLGNRLRSSRDPWITNSGVNMRMRTV